MPACAGLLEPRESGFKPLKSTFNAKNFIRKLFWSVSSNFDAIHSLKRVSQFEIAKHLLKALILGNRGCLRSSMLRPLKSSSPEPVIMSVPICNGFHARRDSGKIKTF